MKLWNLTKKVGLWLVVVLAITGAYSTYHLYAPIKGVQLNGKYVTRAQVIDIIVRDHIESHLKKD